MNISQIKKLPQLFVSQKHQLPQVSAVYFVLNKLGNIVYIGKSTNLNQRWRNHKIKLPEWIIAYWQVESSELEKLENKLIQEYLPPLNIHYHNPVYKLIQRRKQILARSLDNCKVRG